MPLRRSGKCRLPSGRANTRRGRGQSSARTHRTAAPEPFRHPTPICGVSIACHPPPSAARVWFPGDACLFGLMRGRHHLSSGRYGIFAAAEHRSGAARETWRRGRTGGRLRATNTSGVETPARTTPRRHDHRVATFALQTRRAVSFPDKLGHRPKSDVKQTLSCVAAVCNVTNAGRSRRPALLDQSPGRAGRRFDEWCAPT
jgi:hypothetical protein